MLRKVVISILVILIMLSFCTSFASEYEAVVEEYENNKDAELVTIQESTKGKLTEYIEKYGSTPYGVAAFILNALRIYSIPFCFVGIAVGSIYQYVLGIRKLDVRDKGFALIITFVTILLICQVLPLVFAIVVKGWRG